MPWCEACSRFYNPNSLPADGRCPACGQPVPAVSPKAKGRAGGKAAKAPWHFWVLVGAAGIYLAWRAIQGLGWLIGQL